jgi:uncharacterized protein YkwD
MARRPKHQFLFNYSLATLTLSLALTVGAIGQGTRSTDCRGPQIFNAAECSGDSASADEKALFDLVNKYRVANNKPQLKPSTGLNLVANRRMLDLRQNMRSLTHSWSNCPYDIKNEKTWACVQNAPVTLHSGYQGQGYETLFRTASVRVDPKDALETWKKSSLHNSIILNLDLFANMAWDEMGVGIDGEYAALWFGCSSACMSKAGLADPGLGVSYEQAMQGLTKSLSMANSPSVAGTDKWSGQTSDKKFLLELSGSRIQIAEAAVGITMRLEPNDVLNMEHRSVLAKFLKNVFPEWPDVETWIDRSVAAITIDRSSWRSKTVRGISIQMRAQGTDSIKLTVKPQPKSAGYMEF